MVRLADSDLFRKLPAANVRILLEHIEKISVAAGDLIITEGNSGDYYYVIEAGTCLVSRRDVDGAPRALAELGVGEAFGEEEMVVGPSRNASVTMLSDGELLRLSKHQFIDVVRDALVDTVPYAIARRMYAEGAIWIDVRDAKDYSEGALDNAINLPLGELRENAKDLLKDQPYLVCGESAGAASVGTLLLAQRGFDAVCMSEPVSAALRIRSEQTSAEKVRVEPNDARATVVPFPSSGDGPVNPVEQAQHREKALGIDDVESTDPIPRDLYDDTYVGQSLADLIDQMHSRHKQLLTPNANGTGTDAQAVDVIDLESFQAEVEEVLPVIARQAPALSLADDESHAAVDEAQPMADHASSLYGTEAGIGTSPGNEPALDDADADDIGELMRSIEATVRTQLERSIEVQREVVRNELAERVSTVKQAAIREVRKQVEAYRDRYRTEHAHREEKLKGQYDKLMELAHRISRQKAELQTARKDLQLKLDATSRLQSEIDSLRTNLSGHLDSFDGIDDTGEF